MQDQSTLKRPRRKKPTLNEIALLFTRAKGRCGICHEELTPDDVSIDHVIPLAKGGADHLDNWQLAHRRCNARKYTTVPAGAAARLRATQVPRVMSIEAFMAVSGLGREGARNLRQRLLDQIVRRRPVDPGAIDY